MKKVSFIAAFLLLFTLSFVAIGQQASVRAKLFKIYQVSSIATSASGEFNLGGTTSGLIYTNSSGTNYRVLNTGASALTAGATVTLTPTTVNTFTLTPGEDETINCSSVPAAGTPVRLIITTSGTTSRTLTFNTGFKTTGTLATGTTSAKVFTISFISNGTLLVETSRTTAM